MKGRCQPEGRNFVEDKDPALTGGNEWEKRRRGKVNWEDGRHNPFSQQREEREERLRRVPLHGTPYIWDPKAVPAGTPRSYRIGMLRNGGCVDLRKKGRPFYLPATLFPPEGSRCTLTRGRCWKNRNQAGRSVGRTALVQEKLLSAPTGVQIPPALHSGDHPVRVMVRGANSSFIRTNGGSLNTFRPRSP